MYGNMGKNQCRKDKRKRRARGKSKPPPHELAVFGDAWFTGTREEETDVDTSMLLHDHIFFLMSTSIHEKYLSLTSLP